MNSLIIAGLSVAGCTISVDRYIPELPAWTAVILYGAATVLLIAGMIHGRREKREQAGKTSGK